MTTGLTREPSAAAADPVISVVVDMLTEGGHESVQFRAVARRAAVSMTTIYKRAGTREELIAAAVESWVADNLGQPIPAGPPGEPLADGLMRIFRHVFGPWERNPAMLRAYQRVRSGPRGQAVERRAWAAVEPSARALLAGAPPDYAADIEVVLTHVANGLIVRVAAGEISAADILPLLDRVVRRLTSDNSAEAARAAGTAQ
jgi:AcrR family transcriptional regulator